MNTAPIHSPQKDPFGRTVPLKGRQSHFHTILIATQEWRKKIGWKPKHRHNQSGKCWKKMSLDSICYPEHCTRSRILDSEILNPEDQLLPKAWATEAVYLSSEVIPREFKSNRTDQKLIDQHVLYYHRMKAILNNDSIKILLWKQSSIDLLHKYGTVDISVTYPLINIAFYIEFDFSAVDPQLWTQLQAFSSGLHELTSREISSSRSFMYFCTWIDLKETW